MCQSNVQHSVKTAWSCTVVKGSSSTVQVARFSFLGHHERIKMSHGRCGK